MTLRIVLTDGNNIQGLVGTFGAFIQTNIIQTATDAAAAAASAAAAAASAALAASDESSAASSASAAANSASAAASSATSALNSASAANSSATAAAASATNSASSATAAAGSATNAANSATAASGSATTANTSATNAAASATAAANSATAAAGSATSAANTAAQLNSEYSFSTTGGTTTLTSGQAASGIIVVNGALTSNATIVVPATPHNFSVRNNTTGNYSVTFQASGQVPTASVVQGKSTAFYSDASGVYAASASAGVAFGAINPYAGNVSLTIAHLGNVIEQSTNGAITTLPLAATFPAGSGVAIKDRSSTGAKIATQGSDTCELAVPYSTTPQDVFYLYSDGVSVWKVGFYANAETPTFSGTVNAKGGITFADGTLQTTANSTTQPASTWYTVGATDTVGSFADGDTAIRTSGFTAPFVDVIKNGLVLTRGQHYTLNADGIHINFTDPLINNGVDSDQLEVKTKAVYNPSSTYAPSLPWFTPAAGATFIPYVHVVGFAWLLMRGTFLQVGVDYTEDATGFYLVGFAADGVEQYGVFNLNAINIANALAAVNPIVASGPIQFADGTQQGTAAVGRNRIINGDCRVAQRAAVAVSTSTSTYGGPDRFNAQLNGSAGGQFTQSTGSITYNGVARPAVTQTVNTVVQNLSGSNAWLGIGQVIEGNNCFDLVGQKTTLSFLFQTNVTGTYNVAVRDGAASQSYVTTFAAISGVAQRVVLQIPAIPAAANIPNSTAAGMSVFIGALNNATFLTSTPNQWVAGNFVTAIGGAWGGTVGNYISVSELQLEAGNTAAPVFERKTYEQNFLDCSRYFVNVTCNAAYITGQTNGPCFSWQLPVPMRIVPALSSNITTSNMVSTTPGANQWGALTQGIAWLAVSSGTPVMAWQATGLQLVQMYITGAVYNVMASLFSVGTGISIVASSEL